MLLRLPSILKTLMPSSSIHKEASFVGAANFISPEFIAVAPSDAPIPWSPKTPVITARSEKLHPTVLAIEPAILIASKRL